MKLPFSEIGTVWIGKEKIEFIFMYNKLKMPITYSK